MRISDWSSDVCSSDLGPGGRCRSRSSRPPRDIGRPPADQRAAWSWREPPSGADRAAERRSAPWNRPAPPTGSKGDRTSGVWGKSVSVRVDVGGRRRIKKKKEYVSTNSKERQNE